MTKEHWCPEYRQLQQRQAAARAEKRNPLGDPPSGYNGLDVADLTRPASTRSLTGDEAKRLVENSNNAAQNLNDHLLSCDSCIKHFEG
jgi:hypothetical protein